MHMALGSSLSGRAPWPTIEGIRAAGARGRSLRVESFRNSIGAVETRPDPARLLDSGLSVTPFVTHSSSEESATGVPTASPNFSYFVADEIGNEVVA